MAIGSARSSLLARSLQLNALALAFSLSHVVGDYGVLTDGRWGRGTPPLSGYLVAASAIYGWWGWSLARAASGHRAALISLLTLSAIWAGLLNGGSLIFTSPTILVADVIHFGSLLCGIAAAYATWRLLRADRPTQAPAAAAEASPHVGP